MDEIFQDFIQETGELLESLEKNLLTLTVDKKEPAVIDEIFRAAHTIKGTSAFLEVYTLADITHVAEDLLQKIRDNEIELTEEIIDKLFIALDALKEIYELLKNGKEITDSYENIVNFLKSDDNVIATEEKKTDKISIDQDIIEEIKNIKSEIKELDSIVPEKIIDEKQTEKQNKNEKKLKFEETIRIKINKLNNVINLIGELVTINSGFNLIDREIDNQEFSKLNIRHRKVLTRLRDISLSLRMMPISQLFDKFPRLVRDLSKRTGKKVNLNIIESDTEIDKNIIEELYEPLLHLIRNSIDHGIESAEMRKLTGKPEAGEIILKSYHHESHVIIEIIDDGMGIDFDSVLKKASESGLISRNDTSIMNLDDIVNLIFEPGFSTTETVSEISGRGVGMDVVQSKIEALHGVINVNTSPGVGTTFSIKLPVTLAITQILLVENFEHIFGIPLISVIENVKISPSEIEQEPEYSFFNLRGEAIRLIFLDDILGINTKKPEPDFFHVVIVHHGEYKAGIIVKQLAGKQEVVLKSFGSFLGKRKGVMGASILGDGRLVPVLEIGTLIRDYLNG